MKQEYQNIRATLLAMTGAHENSVIVNRSLAEFSGSRGAGMMLSQLMYWAPRAKLPGGWIAKSDKEFAYELVGSAWEIRKARESLLKLEVIEVKKAQFAGAPTTHYRLKWESLVEKWIRWLHARENPTAIEPETQDSAHPTKRLVSPTKASVAPTSRTVENNESITDTTTETTPETTTKTGDSDVQFEELFGPPKEGAESDLPPRPEGMTDTEYVALCSQRSIESFIERDDGGVNWATPSQAGGSHSAVAGIIDGICKFNGIPRASLLPEAERQSMQTKVAEILARWGGATVEQARVAWLAWVEQYAWKGSCNPWYESFDSELGMKLVAVKEGSISEQSLQAKGQDNDDSGATLGRTVNENAQRIGQALAARARKPGEGSGGSE